MPGLELAHKSEQPRQRGQAVLLRQVGSLTESWQFCIFTSGLENQLADVGKMPVSFVAVKTIADQKAFVQL